MWRLQIYFLWNLPVFQFSVWDWLVSMVMCLHEKYNEMGYRPKVSADGGWSDWSPWSSCDVDCSRNRSRECSTPSPFHGGADCPGAFSKNGNLVLRVFHVIALPSPRNYSRADATGCPE